MSSLRVNVETIVVVANRAVLIEDRVVRVDDLGVHTSLLIAIYGTRVHQFKLKKLNRSYTFVILTSLYFKQVYFFHKIVNYNANKDENNKEYQFAH